MNKMKISKEIQTFETEKMDKDKIEKLERQLEVKNAEVKKLKAKIDRMKTKRKEDAQVYKDKITMIRDISKF